MLLSTAIPIVIAAIVIVIISRGRSSNPIRPSTNVAARRLGIIPIIESKKDRNNIRNIKVMPNITKPNDNI